MRFVVISQATDLQTLRQMLFTGQQPGTSAGAALERVQRLNPHLDLQHLAPGTVLLLPDLPGLDPAQGHAIGEDVFHTLSRDISGGLDLIGQSLHATSEALDAERTALESVIDTDAIRRMMDDQTLSTQIHAGHTGYVTGRKELQAASAAVEQLQKDVAAELAALGKLLRFPAR
jgi:hypothetical protein